MASQSLPAQGALIFIFSWEGLRQLLSGAHLCCGHDWILDLSPLPASPRQQGQTQTSALPHSLVASKSLEA